MKNSQCSNLKIDDYLDLLNLTVQLGDIKWQNEIKRKLHKLQVNTAEKQNA